MRRVVASALLLSAALTGCTSQQPDPATDVVVTGELGEAPELEYETPLTVDEPVVEVISEGTGPVVVDDEPILVDYYAESGDDRSLVGETYSTDPKPYQLSAENLGRDIYEALSGRTVGTRLLHVVPPAEGQSAPTVTVFDILPTRASGEPVAPREGLPTVELDEDGTPTVTIPPTEPPGQLVVAPLIRGNGRQVSEGDVVTVQYVGVRWSDGTVFDSSWAPGKLPSAFPIGVGEVIAGWDVGLVDQPVGSQVLLVVPPALAYGGSEHELAAETLVFVVDILAARGPTTD